MAVGGSGRRGVQSVTGRVSGSGVAGYRSGVGRSAQGADAFLGLSKRLKAAGDTELRKELHKAVRDAAKPLIPKIRKAARESLPRQGGLNERIAKKPYRSQARTGVKTAGVRITGTKIDPRINQGRIPHPVFGRTGKPKNGGKNFVVQTVPRADGYFDDTIREAAPQVRDDIIDVLAEFTKRLTRPL